MRRLLSWLMLVFATSGVVHGEVSMTSADGPAGLMILASIGDSSDPINSWLPIRSLQAGQILNATGDARGDGRPDAAFDPTSRYPFVTWAYNAGGDFDIAYSEWDGVQWGSTEFLTATTADQLDPRVWIQADGTVHVVWWEDAATDAVFVRTRPSGAALWNSPLQVSEPGKSARRPSVTHFDGVVQVTFEQESTTVGMVRDVVVAKDTGAGFSRSAVYSTTRTEPLNSMIHSQGTALWLDWQDDGGVLGCATWDGIAWSVDPPEPWLDPSWIGAEETRRAIRSRAMP